MCLVFENISFCVRRKIKFILLRFVSVVKTTEKLEKLRKMVCGMIFGDIKCSIRNADDFVFLLCVTDLCYNICV